MIGRGIVVEHQPSALNFWWYLTYVQINEEEVKKTISKDSEKGGRADGKGSNKEIRQWQRKSIGRAETGQRYRNLWFYR